MSTVVNDPPLAGIRRALETLTSCSSKNWFGSYVSRVLKSDGSGKEWLDEVTWDKMEETVPMEKLADAGVQLCEQPTSPRDQDQSVSIPWTLSAFLRWVRKYSTLIPSEKDMPHIVDKVSVNCDPKQQFRTKNSQSPDTKTGSNSTITVEDLIASICRGGRQVKTELDLNIRRIVEHLVCASVCDRLMEVKSASTEQKIRPIIDCFQDLFRDNEVDSQLINVFVEIPFKSAVYFSLCMAASKRYDYMRICLAWAAESIRSSLNWDRYRFICISCLLQMICQPKALESHLERFQSLDNFSCSNDCALRTYRIIHSRAMAETLDGSREKHRHGACLYLSSDSLRQKLQALSQDKKLDKEVKASFWISCEAILTSMQCDDFIISTGKNLEVLTRGWKNRNLEEKGRFDTKCRWKVIHAEIDAVCKAITCSRVRSLFLADSVIGEDMQAAGLKFANESIELSPKLREVMGLLERLRLHLEDERTFWGCLEVMVVELDDNDVNFCPSHACPLCIKGLKRWFIGVQTYTVDLSHLIQSEPITWDPFLICESLRSYLDHLASVAVELPSARTKRPKINASST